MESFKKAGMFKPFSSSFPLPKRQERECADKCDHITNCLIPFKKTNIHNGGLLSCMGKWLCSNWMINHIPALTIF